MARAKAKASSSAAASKNSADKKLGQARNGRGSGKVDEQYLKEAIKKTLRKQFPGWGSDLVDSKQVNGLSLRESLTLDRKHWILKDEIGSKIKLSPSYYESKRLAYARALPTGESLTWDKTSEAGQAPLAPKLIKALAMVADNKRELGPLRQYIKDAKTMTAKDRFAG